MRSVSEVTDSYYRTLRQRVDAWQSTPEARSAPCASLYRHLPDLYRFLLGLALDTRLPVVERAGLVSALKYIIAPHDFVPEAVLGVRGFCDDLVLAALVVDRLYERCDAGLLAEHWTSTDDPREVSQTILEAAGNLVNETILFRLSTLLPT